MPKKKLKIHSQNILPILKKWLYSDKDIFIRELVSNSVDALSKCKILRNQGELEAKDEEFRIDVKVDKENKTITIADTGIGMTSEEVDKYIAQLAFSGAEEFLEKYESGSKKDQIIGHFGLGFYSSFMVSSTVQLDTLSYKKEATAAFWESDGESDYTLKAGKRETRGTEITLQVTDADYLEEDKLSSILKKHCEFLPFPIYLNETHINPKEPIWLKAPSELTDEDYLDFYRHMYPMDPDPIFWIHLNVDYPFNLQGVLYFPKITKRFDYHKTNLHLYCNRVYVSDNCKDLIPDYLTVLRGVIDSPDIPLNISRSYLQMDKTVRSLSTHISKKVSDKLKKLHEIDKETFTTKWEDIELIVKLGILQDEKFYERVKSILLYKNDKEEWTSIDDYLSRNKEKFADKVFYNPSPDSQFLKMYQEKQIEVLLADSYLDTPIMNFLESKLAPVKFQRIDGGVDEMLIDKEREKNVVDENGKSHSIKLAEFFKNTLGKDTVEVEAKSLTTDDIPGFVMISEETRRLRDYLSMSGNEIPTDLMDKQTLVVNTNNSLVESIYNLKDENPELAKELTMQIYELSLLSQRELSPKNIGGFISRSTAILEKMAHGIALKNG